MKKKKASSKKIDLNAVQKIKMEAGNFDRKIFWRCAFPNGPGAQ